MARNKFDVDERLETPFDFKHFKRAMVYVKRYKWKMILALSLSAISAIVALIGPLLTKEAVDVAIPDGNIPYIVFLSIGFLLSIIVSVVLGNIRQRIMTKAGQLMIYDIRKDLLAASWIELDGSGIWTLYERSAEGDWSEVDYGTLRANGDNQYEAVSDAYEDVSYDLYLADDNAMYWGGENDYYQRT